MAVWLDPWSLDDAKDVWLAQPWSDCVMDAWLDPMLLDDALDEW